MAASKLTPRFPYSASTEEKGPAMIYHGTVKAGVIELDDAELPEGTLVKVEPLELKAGTAQKRPGTSLADWAEQNAEEWGGQLSSENVEAFTGRRF